MDQRQLKHVKEIPFEVSKQHLMGIRTEQAALKIVSDVAAKLKAKVRRMVLPPKPPAWSRGVGECDAILLTDVAIFLVEVKRFGGQIKLLDDVSARLPIIKAGKDDQISNPAIEVCQKSDTLRALIREFPEWRLVNKLFDVARLGQSVPVVPVLCLGPSTTVDEVQVRHKELIVCNTRNIRSKLKEAVSNRKAVLGVSHSMGHLVAGWRTIGKLAIQGKPGFLRAWPIRTEGQTMSFADLSQIKCLKTGRLHAIYSDKVKVSTKAIKSVIFGSYLQRQMTEFECPTDMSFSWTSAS